MRTSGKQSRRMNWPKPPKSRMSRTAIENKRLAEQTRKVLSKHYANKYRVR